MTTTFAFLFVVCNNNILDPWLLESVLSLLVKILVIGGLQE